MATLNDALRALERHVGFSQSRSRNQARRLQDAGLLQTGTPSAPPQVMPLEFLRLFVVCAADRRLRDADEIAATYLDLTPGGIPINQAPASVGTAASALLALMASPREDVRHVRIEIVANWPEVALHWPGETQRYNATGANPDHWQAGGHRRSTVVPGTAFADAVHSIYGDRVWLS